MKISQTAEGDRRVAEGKEMNPAALRGQLKSDQPNCVMKSSNVVMFLVLVLCFASTISSVCVQLG